MSDNKGSEIDGTTMGVGIALGAGVGIALGTSLGNLAMGVPVGISLGVAYVLVMRDIKRSKSKQED